jgi:dihydroorotate dehydrogenase
MVKLSPVLDPGQPDGPSRLEEVLAVCEEAAVDGYVCCNTLPVDHPTFGRGGVSGHVIRFKAWRMCQFIADQLKRPVIGCGGVYIREDMDGYLKRGCVAVQVYNGFVRGPMAGGGFAHRLLSNETAIK